jgi:predicted transcriptional regulator
VNFDADEDSFDGVVFEADEYVLHYGTPHSGSQSHSGRYKWGSGENPGNGDFLSAVKELRKRGMSDTDIAKGFGMKSPEFRDVLQEESSKKKRSQIETAQKLSAKGMSNVAIGKQMGIGESQVRNLLKPGEIEKTNIIRSTSDMLRREVEKKKYVDVGHGTELYLDISKEKLRSAVTLLKREGYQVYPIPVDQLGTSHKTTFNVLTAPGVTYKEAVTNRDHIRQITNVVTNDGGLTYTKLPPPVSISSKRVKVRYAEEGGADADGVIYVRPGVKDLSLGRSSYAQVRIAVDGTHFLKGMAIYKDDLPVGTDLVFNTNKRDTGNKLDAMKPMKDDTDLPFGAVTRPPTSNIGRDHTESAMNIVNEEGDWTKWSKTLSSQMLSKQPVALAKSQLDEAYERKRQELDDILGLTNPAVRRKLLLAYSDGVDSAAVHLKAAALPRQASYVILPINSMKPNEIYAPKFRDGERVVLVRFPHGGTFEIPEVTVNNRHPEARKLLGTNPRDAIGIHSSVAERLSGADFDGDTVLVIPNNSGRVKSSPALEGLKGFDPKQYKLTDDVPRMSLQTMQTEMGKVSNLITDMTIGGANSEELARAVRHSMVVIDAEKHHLDYRRSARENGIAALAKRYQISEKNPHGGAATLISRSGTSSAIRIPEIVERKASDGGGIDKATGKKMYTTTGASYVDKKTGKVVVKTTEIARLANVDDAHLLVSDRGMPIEKIYADHSNRMKALANLARKEMVNTKNQGYSPSARVAYAPEVQKLEAALRLAVRNSPRERQALVVANAQVAMKLQANPNLEKSEIKKIKSQALKLARQRMGAEKQYIQITDRDWAAIQAGAIHNKMLEDILDNADLDKVKELATPREAVVMSQYKKDRARKLAERGHTPAEIADALGVSVATLEKNLGGAS